MLPIRLDIPSTFLEEEDRGGYIVTARMKMVWAIQLDLLNEFKKVCTKYNLQYFADSGTLLGAVRHKGYIPWDDDIDIVMTRNDYSKLIEIAKLEFKAPYFLQSAHSEFFPRGYARLRNSNTTALTRNDLYYETNHVFFNHGIFIDIFPLDNLPDNMFKRIIWLTKINILKQIIRVGILNKAPADYGLIKKILRIGAKGIHKVVGYDNLINMYEKLCGKYNNTTTKNISYVAYSGGKKKHIWKNECFASAKSVPFEFTDIMIPVDYDSRLRTEYQNYMQVIRNDTTHGKMTIEPDIPFKEYMNMHSTNELMELL